MHIVSTRLVLLSFLLFFLVHLLYVILYIYLYIHIFYFSHVFLSNTCFDIHKANNNGKLYIYIHCYISYSEEVKHIADDSLSIGKAG